MEAPAHKISQLSAMALSISTMIGSGWLFASYYAVKSAGAASIFSWILCAVFVMIMALQLAEIACKHTRRGLFSRLLTLSHNNHFGFVTAISNWLVGVIAVPSEAIATMQYISTASPTMTDYIFYNHSFTPIGVLFTALLLGLFFLLNYWGIKLLVRFNNVMAVVKVAMPIITAIAIGLTAFHATNFTAYKHSIIPYGMGSIVSTIVTSGIFYSFFGFQTAVSFASELENPLKSIPITLISSVAIALLLYVMLQVCFIGAVPTAAISNGWEHLQFTSPLAELAISLNLNLLAIALYVDAGVSPASTGITYLGASTRMLTAMAQHEQVPSYFAVLSPFNMSRRSLVFTFMMCLLLIIFFKNWQSIAVFTTAFILMSCIALPIAYVKLAREPATDGQSYRFKLGKPLAPVVFLFLTYLFFFIPYYNLVVLFAVHLIAFFTYAVINSRHDLRKLINIFNSAWSILLYMLFLVLYVKFSATPLLQAHSQLTLVTGLALALGIYFLMLGQRE